MNTIRLPLFLASAILLGSIGAAQITTDSITVGGSGSLSSAGSSNPGKLDDGITVASATYEFTLDTAAKTLKIKITNTSPVVVGVPNPLLTDVFFNLPSQVTGATLTNQTSSGGVTPVYALTFDANTTTPPNNGADGMGAFNVLITDTGNIQGTIANPNADTYTVSGTLLAMSPVTFTLTLTGTLTGLTADDITALLSHIPPGNNPSHAVGHFRAGGVGGAFSAFINEGQPCQGAASSVILGSPCGGSLTVSPPVPGGFSTATYNGSTPLTQAIVMFSRSGGTPFTFSGCTIFTKNPTKVGVITTTDANGDFQISNPVPTTFHICGSQLVLQAMVLDPNNPNHALEVSNGVLVTMGF